MKLNIKNITLSIVIALFLSACESDAEFKNSQENIILQIGQQYEVQSGDAVIKDEQNTTIKVIHELNNNTKLVTLLSGSATLIKGNYELNE